MAPIGLHRAGLSGPHWTDDSTVSIDRRPMQTGCMSYDDAGSLDDAFRNTVVRVDVDGESLVFDPLEAPFELPWVGPVHVITAWNPGRFASAHDNERRNRELEGALVAGGHDYFDAVGRARDGQWEERGFAVLGADRTWAVELGRRFGQLAIFELTTEGLRVLPC